MIKVIGSLFSFFFFRPRIPPRIIIGRDKMPRALGTFGDIWWGGGEWNALYKHRTQRIRGSRGGTRLEALPEINRSSEG